MKYGEFYRLFLQHGFTYMTTDRNADIYARDGHEYRFNFAGGTIHRHPNRKAVRRFNRTILETKHELLKYFKDERASEAVELRRQKKR